MVVGVDMVARGEGEEEGVYRDGGGGGVFEMAGWRVEGSVRI